MSHYIMYRCVSNPNSYIVEILNEGIEELQSVEKDLIERGYVITEVRELTLKVIKVDK